MTTASSFITPREAAPESPAPASSTKPSKYFLKLAGCAQWEQVDKFVYDKWTQATRDGKQRYDGNSVEVNGTGTVTIKSGVPMCPDDIGRIARFAGCSGQIVNGSYSMQGGIVLNPDFVPMTIKGRSVLRDVKNGKTWKNAA